jgi:hypothetical protein
MAALVRQIAGVKNDNSPLVLDERAGQVALDRAGRLRSDEVDNAAARAVEAHRAAQGRLNSAFGKIGVPVRYFFQPDAFADEFHLDTVRSLYEVVPGLITRPEFGEVLQRTASQLAPEVTNLRDIYRTSQQPLYLDVVHTNETAAGLLADRVIESLRGELVKLAN